MVPEPSDDLTVAEAAEALGTSPQTVRKLLREGDLRGRKEPWGSRFVWIPSRKGVEDFLSQYGRLDGQRRRPPVAAVPSPPEPDVAPPRPFYLRPRGRATVVVFVLGVPLLLAYATAQILPGALWFDELGQLSVFLRVAAAKAQLWVAVAGTVAIFVGASLDVAVSRARVARTRAVNIAIVAASLITATLFAASAAGHWRTFLLWRHRQAFGIEDPVFGKDVGFYVFSLPFHLLVSGLLLALIAVAAAGVALVYRSQDALSFKPLRATYEAQTQLAGLAAGFLLVVAWRFWLQRYALELGQPSPGDANSIAGAGYTDVHVRSPGLAALSILTLVLAGFCVAAPRMARSGHLRRARLSMAVPAAAIVVVLVSAGAWLPAIVQRFVVNPNPLLSEQQYIQRSIAATRHGLGLDAIEVHPYSPAGRLSAADVARARAGLENVAVWDRSVIEARTRDLVSAAPYYRPDRATYADGLVDGRRQLTITSARELDVRRAGGDGRSWASDRLAYTHGLGLPRFSATDIERGGQPRRLDAGLGIRQPRIYFGDLPAGSPQWVLVRTRRPETDLPGPNAASYHYDGTAGIALSAWIRRAAFALHFSSKDLLISDDITHESRILLHRDVRDRLRTLAPFIQWDSRPAPLAVDGRIVFVADGYTTSATYPYAERIDLGGASVSYARSSVRATVDAFSGKVDLYVTDESDPLARAWAHAFPSLFHRADDMPAWLRARARYPTDLFAAQTAAYGRFHTTRPDVFASGSDVWSPPTSLSGSIEVAGDIQFDESDEDDLRRPAQPEYKFSSPPGRTRARLVLSTNFSPRRGQNLVASLDGWVDERGRPRLASRILPRDPITLGPAQVSRLVFSTPRVSNLLGLSNLELRDLNKSSLDTVSLGRPRLAYLPRGIIQIQSLYKGASGPGVSRIIGVTAFLNGRAGVGSDIDDAVRQALHEPPRVDVLPPRGRPTVGKPVKLRFRVSSAQRELMTITSPAGIRYENRSVQAGSRTVVWVPPASGHARVRVAVKGMDGSTVADSTAFEVLSRPPTVRLTRAPTRAVVGRPARFTFRVKNSLSEVAEIATREGTFTRRYLIRDRTGVIRWTPTAPGRAVLRVRSLGRQGQTAVDTARITVRPGPRAVAPTVTLIRAPDGVTVGRRSEIAFRVAGSRVVVAQIAGDRGEARVWRFPRATGRVAFTWIPTRPGVYRLTVSARAGHGITTRVATALTAERAR